VTFTLRRGYTTWLSADEATASFSLRYLNWFIPAMALQFALVAMGAALRGLGDMKVPTVIQISTVLLNIVLAPVLMFGWGTGHPFGVAGAATASFVAVGFGCIAFTGYFLRAGSDLRFHPADWPPRLTIWWNMLKVGLPVGGEFALMTVYLVFVYGLIRPFGAAAQAGFGIGARVMQSLFLPSVAIGFAAAPVAGQNFGAGHTSRVRDTFHSAAAMSVLVMVILTMLCKIAPASMVRIFSADPAVVAFGSEYLRIISWNFVASGLVFVSSSVFQGIGNTLPSLSSSVMRVVIFAVPAYMLSRQPGFEMDEIWYLAVATVFVQAGVNILLLHRELRHKHSLAGGLLSRHVVATLE
jgi:putative MATE family efflux protein